MSKFLQYELWKNCRNNCKFCYNLGQKNFKDIKERIYSIISNLDKFDSDKFSDFGITGGEFFDGQLQQLNIKNEFYELISKICQLIKENKIKRFLVTTALMHEDSRDIEEFIQFLKKKKCLEKVLFCTSYDTKYRFTDKTLSYWKTNIKKLYKKHKIHLHTEIIMTDDFICSVLDGNIDIVEFEKTYNTAVDFIQPSVPFGLDISKHEFEKRVPGFFPKRNNFLQLLEKWICSGYNLSRLLCIDDHSNEMHGVINGEPKTIYDRDIVEKYISPYRNADQVGYIDSDKFMRKDVEALLEI